MKFFVAFFALATVASARNIVFSGGNGNGGSGLRPPYHQQSFTLTPTASRAQSVQSARVVAVQPVQARLVAVQPVQQAQVQLIAIQPVQQVQQVQQTSAPIQAAVQSTYNLQVVDVPTQRAQVPTQTIVIGPSVQPLDFEFQSQSSPISVRQTHIPGTPNPPQSSSHQDEPDILRQEIVKPIVHEVTEAIQPIRRIQQEVRPVQETITQILSRGQEQRQTVQAAPVQAQAIAVQAVPVQTVAVQAAPVQTVAVAAQPANIQTVAIAQNEPAISTIELVEADGAQGGLTLGSLSSGLSGSLQIVKKKK